MKGIRCKTERPFDRIPAWRGMPEWKAFDVSRRGKAVCRASPLPDSRLLCSESGICRQESEVRGQARREKSGTTFGETPPAIIEPDADMLAEKSIRDDQVDVVVAIDILSNDSQTQCIVMKKEEGPGGRITA